MPNTIEQCHTLGIWGQFCSFLTHFDLFFCTILTWKLNDYLFWIDFSDLNQIIYLFWFVSIWHHLTFYCELCQIICFDLLRFDSFYDSNRGFIKSSPVCLLCILFLFQLQKNVLLTICNDRILQEVTFDKYRCARLVMDCLCAWQDNSMNRMSVAICSILGKDWIKKQYYIKIGPECTVV